MTEFTPLSSALGGVLVGVAGALLLLLHGRIAGISGIVGGLVDRGPRGDRAWRIAFVLGLFSAGLLAHAWMPERFGTGSPASAIVLVVAGLLVGFGTRLGNGCTSGHGVCGVSRLSRRSLVATATFMLAGAVTVFLTHHVGG